MFYARPLSLLIINVLSFGQRHLNPPRPARGPRARPSYSLYVGSKLCEQSTTPHPHLTVTRDRGTVSDPAVTAPRRVRRAARGRVLRAACTVLLLETGSLDTRSKNAFVRLRRVCGKWDVTSQHAPGKAMRGVANCCLKVIQ